MESKIMIDINYASRSPQIKILYKHSDDPRDTLVSMFTGGSMPGVNDGYCHIERYPGRDNDTEAIVITPVHPVEMIKHIPTIAKFAEENPAADTSDVPASLKRIIEGEYTRISGVPMAGETQQEALKKADNWAVQNLPHDLYKAWHKEMFGFEPSKSFSQK